MNRNKLKTYAPQARREFIQAVTDRAAHYGLSAKKIEPMTEKGDVALIGGRSFPRSVGEKRKKLEARIQKLGFGQTMEAVAYSWFNRLVAIRFMELHGYLEHGYRVLSHPDGRSQPEILEHAAQVDLPGLDQQKVIALKLEGTKEEELYRVLLVGQCNALHKALPFLFEAVDDETELLLPDHLLHSDSLIRKLVNEIPEEDWQEVEIIGWLYQFYISEKKDEVIGKVVKSEDIPAATQLFTPNWIVKYLVQNSLGRQWMATYPHSPLKAKMEYYIEPAEQTPEIQAKLAEITPTTLNPEELTLLDPACGSGHILVEAYDLLKNIYQERGYRAKDIPRLILEKNLFGLEIDDRAAQLAAFALMMKARADDRSIFERGVQPHVLAIQESKGMDAKEITEALNQAILKEQLPPSGELFEEIADAKSPLFSKKVIGVKGAVSQADVAHLISLFEQGKTFGSLIQVPEKLADKLPEIAERVKAVTTHGGMFEKAAAKMFTPIVYQAQLLAGKYEAVVANPPYMGGKGMAPSLKQFAKSCFPRCRPDLYAMFFERAYALCEGRGHIAYVTMHSWMFLPAFQHFREWLLRSGTILSMIHLGARAFTEISGEVVQTTAFSFGPSYIPAFKPTFINATEGDEQDKLHTVRLRNKLASNLSQDEFARIPGAPVAYWVSESVVQSFNNERLKEIADIRAGIGTSDNERFLRYWFEVDLSSINFTCTSIASSVESGKTWFPYNKGGSFRKWYGNREFVVNWKNDGQEIKHAVVNNPSDPNTTHWSRRIFNTEYFFRPSLTWNDIGGGELSVRSNGPGFIHDAVGVGAYGIAPESRELEVLAFLNSRVAFLYTEILCPTLHFKPGQMGEIPIIAPKEDVVSTSRECIAISEDDWNSSEFSWDFQRQPLLMQDRPLVSESYEELCGVRKRNVDRMARLETFHNECFIKAYGVADLVTAEVQSADVTLRHSNVEEEIKRLASYAVGCIMGRYSLDEPGLIYAHSSNRGFDPSNYRKFPIDEDGIIPFTEFNWFPDDAASRFEKFIATAWPAEMLEENLKFVAKSLGTKKGETSRDTIRRYLANDFYKHHLSIYKKRPIYWLFSSGKQRGFQALVYLHRYNEGTLARMRTEYVIPLLGKMTARISHLTDDSAAATSSQHKKRLEIEKSVLVKQLAEIQSYDERLRHFADKKIVLDLNEGIAVNYQRFAGLVAESSLAGKIAYIAADFDAPLDGFQG